LFLNGHEMERRLRETLSRDGHARGKGVGYSDRIIDGNFSAWRFCCCRSSSKVRRIASSGMRQPARPVTITNDLEDLVRRFFGYRVGGRRGHGTPLSVSARKIDVVSR